MLLQTSSMDGTGALAKVAALLFVAVCSPSGPCSSKRMCVSCVKLWYERMLCSGALLFTEAKVYAFACQLAETHAVEPLGKYEFVVRDDWHISGDSHNRRSSDV